MLHYESLSNRIVPALYRVHKSIGTGLLETCYEKAMAVEFDHLGIAFTRQQEFPVFHRLKKVGSYYADMVVDGKIILEIKSVSSLDKKHEAQLLNYLSISGLSLGYLVNFRNPRLEIQRLVL